MYSSSLLVLALAVFGASAQSLGCNGGLLGVSGLNGGFVSGIGNGFLGGVSNGIVSGGLLGGVSGTGVSTPVLENVPLRLPSIVHPTSVQDSCNCIKTVVRPQLRKEVFNIPSVQRFVQTTSTPVVETVPYVSGSSVDVPTVSATGVETGLIGNGLVSGVNTGLVSGGLVSGGFGGFNGVVGGFGGLNGVAGINSGFGGLNGVVSTC